jgi:hypothetical protein
VALVSLRFCSSSLPLSLSKLREDLNSRIYCNNTFIRIYNICDVLYVITSLYHIVMILVVTNPT